MRSQEKTALNEIHRKPLLLERPKVLTKMCWKMGVFKASTTLLLLALPEAAHPWWSLCLGLIWEDFDTFEGVRWSFPSMEAPQNHCWGCHGKKSRDLKEPNLPSKGYVLSLLFSVLYSVQSSCKCVIRMSVPWAHYLCTEHLCFQVQYFQKAVLLLALCSSSLSPMKKTNHEKPLYFEWLQWNNFVPLHFSWRRKECSTLSPASAVLSFLQPAKCLPSGLFNNSLFSHCKQRPCV